MNTAEIRATFLDFFRARGHAIVASAPLIPANDPTLMFTNSGMVQFKNVFLGSEKPVSPRAADVQRCLRAGGKHNDLDQVGYTARHHTFFEMLGNWSFGDYFKREAITWSWELLTTVLGLAPERLWVTVYHTDDEAYGIWRDDVGVPEARIIRIGDNKGAPWASDNFWQMADTGPCGPCSEIFYDHGSDIAGGPPGSRDEDGDRFVEIWNLVFMQYDRQPDGELKSLPAPCVDTGMGLERLAAVLQGVHSNYDTDLFQRLIAAAQELTGCEDHASKSLRVIADHIRACSFLIVDGVLPSNEGRGYVLRRIIRRALRHGWMLGVHGEFFWKMVAPLVAEMGAAYPELATAQASVEKALQHEERRFGETLEHGMQIFEAATKDLRRRAEFVDQTMPESGWSPEQMPAQSTIPGDVVFRLYDTYGFPCDLTVDLARERGLRVDLQGFVARMDEQRNRARSAGHFKNADTLPAQLVSTLAQTEFLGYEQLAADGCKVLAIVKDGQACAGLAAGEHGCVLLDRTPFYAQSGGQVGDTGVLMVGGGEFRVEDTRKLGGAFFGHFGTWSGTQPLQAGQSASARVDAARRQAIVLNHSATHLLQAALRQVLGEHVQQKGSLVAPDRLRFDFSHDRPLDHGQLREVEALVNANIRSDHMGEVRHMGYDDAVGEGAMALFGEKYGDVVRVLRFGDFSTELCGGTHVARTGQIGLFKIVSESGVASGVRRIEAVTGATAIDFVNDEEELLRRVTAKVFDDVEASAAAATNLIGALGKQLEEHLDRKFKEAKELSRELAAQRAKQASADALDLAKGAKDVNGTKVVAARVKGMDAKALRETVDTLKQKLNDCVVVLAAAQQDKVALVAGVHGNALARVRAGEVVAHVAKAIGGKGGGRADMAQGGGPDSPDVDRALNDLVSWLSVCFTAETH